MIFIPQSVIRLQNKAKTLAVVALTAFFSGCSWQEYFVIVNETSFPTTVSYTLSGTENGFGLFDNEPSVYPLNPSGDIDWSNKLSITDMDTTQTGISVTLPSRCTLIMGSLMNDHYENHDQKSAGDRVNVKNISINHPERAFEITAENFATFFKKKNGNIEYRINALTLK